jgi:hypothetical protein
MNASHALMAFVFVTGSFAVISNSVGQTVEPPEVISQAAEIPEVVSIVSGGNYVTPWDSGSLSVRLMDDRNHVQDVVVKFTGKIGYELSSLSISTNDWSLDISASIRDLPRVFGNRIVISAPTFDDSGGLESMDVVIPYSASFHPNSPLPPCMTLWLRVRRGGIESSFRQDEKQVFCNL